MDLKQLIGQLLRLSLSSLTTLSIIDSGTTSAETEPKNNLINLTYNNLTIPEYNLLNTNEDQEKKLRQLIFSYKAIQSEEDKDVAEPKIFLTQEEILVILESRFDRIPNFIIEQVNQISDPLFLKQLHQIAQVTSSPEAFENALISMGIKGEETKSLLANSSSIASDLYQDRENQDMELVAEAVEELWGKENQETSSPEIETENIDADNEAIVNTSGKMLSLLDVSPQMLMLMRKSPFAFGAPTTVVEDFASNTQLTGDWGGARSEAAEDGVLFEVYSTTIPQGITSGGNDRNSAISQSLDAYFNLDTGRLGLWPGGVFQFTFQSRFGSNVNADAGSISPVNTAVEWPIAGPDNVGLASEYYLLQAFSPQVLFLIGKFNPTNYADVNVFANNYRYQFQNFALNNNLILGSYAPVSTWGAVLVWQPAKWLQVQTGVLDPNASAENFADDFFKDVTIFQEYNFAYKIAERPGNLRLIWGLDTRDSIDLEDPINFRSFNGRRIVNFRDPIRKNDSSFTFMVNFDQYLFTVDPEATDEYHQRSETSRHHIAHRVYAPPPGLGVFGRFGIGPESQNLISLFGSFGISGVGLIPGREYDQFGLGWYYVGISGELEDFIQDSTLLSDALPAVDGAAENGLELYYNFAITPAIQLTANAQYIFNPALSTEDNVLVLGGRLQVDF